MDFRRPLAVAMIACLFAIFAATPAHAKPRHHKNHHIARPDSGPSLQCASDNNGRTVCGGSIQRTSESRIAYARYERGTVIGGRPAGCPYRFCGCEASRYVFGVLRPDLFLASNWIRKFPRTSPAPGMAAARSGHVFVLISHVSGHDWLVHDGNSGGHLTRRHVRSIARYVIVNPHASRMAMQ